MGNMKPDYSLYLVTDSTEPILKGRDLVQVVKDAIAGGVTIVQLRDKTAETAELIRKAKALHGITKPAGIPLLINDRVDVALAVGCEGVHIGQDDMDITTARRLLGPSAIIGVTASSAEEAMTAAKAGADYLGIGTVFATPTKENTKDIIYPSGVRNILSALVEVGEPSCKDVSTVCIGGINASNAQRVLYQSTSPLGKPLNGIAVVSEIIASPSPADAAKDLKSLLSSSPSFAPPPPKPKTEITQTLKNQIYTSVPSLLKRLASTKPLCHNMTNTVVQNFAANVALAIGASPIMSTAGAEAADLARLGGSLVINMGTLTPVALENYIVALKAYNAVGGPVLLDPVGAGATGVRKAALKELMANGYFSVIKGNESEIRTVFATGASSAGISGKEIQQRGVDSASSTASVKEKAVLVSTLAKRERTTILMTGETDILSNGSRTLAISNGHAYLGQITGSGCTLGTTVAAFLAVGAKEDPLMAVLAGLLMYEIAAERAGGRDDVKGAGTFQAAFLDELGNLREGNGGWVGGAKVEEVEV
ncbi:hydroxyethylthiazole kinase [Aulographum hederae CBS 113979]|uniref:Hydroxyethylthiazole kinase n=1 Tax=Aulographum hederae CBS 113979 TaxID=1176131 RepID=A0A6G1H411_9PEZI|nr:hydroxyethylthiazole kinase [Aulographum hederae CBS 113979]